MRNVTGVRRGRWNITSCTYHWHSQCTDQIQARWPGIDSQQEQEVFHVTTVSLLALECTQASLWRVLGALCPVIGLRSWPQTFIWLQCYKHMKIYLHFPKCLHGMVL